MSEGRVMVCSWERTDDGYHVWVSAQPRLSATGPTFEEADEALYEVIGMATGDGEHVREYVPRRRARLSSFIRRVVSHPSGWGHAYVANADALYDGGVCEGCGNSRGARTGAPIVLDRVESGCDGVIMRYANGWGDGHLYAESFLDLLTPDERDATEWRAVVSPPRGRKRFFEPVRARIHAPLVPIRHWTRPVLYCAVCERDFMPRYDVKAHPMFYVSADAVSDAECFSFSDPDVPMPLLAISAARWEALAGRKGTRGIQSVDLGIADGSAIAQVFERALR